MHTKCLAPFYSTCSHWCSPDWLIEASSLSQCGLISHPRRDLGSRWCWASCKATRRRDQSTVSIIMYNWMQKQDLVSAALPCHDCSAAGISATPTLGEVATFELRASVGFPGNLVALEYVACFTSAPAVMASKIVRCWCNVKNACVLTL